MKHRFFTLDQYQINDFFNPIRSKRDIITLLMKSIKLMLIGNIESNQPPQGYMYLTISKMSRLFYESHNKYFSIGFPFRVSEEENNTLKFYSEDITNIDNRITSDVLAILSEDKALEQECPFSFIDTFIENLEYQPMLWKFLLNLFMFEDGYIRYDHDEERNNGILHPLNHYDLFYSSYTTFKLGLKKQLNIEIMMDCLSIETNCHFIE